MCAGCAGSRYKVTGVLEHHHILPLALDQPSLLLGRPLTTPPSPGMRATPGRKGLLVGVVGVALRPATPLGDAGFVWEEGVVVDLGLVALVEREGVEGRADAPA